MKITISGGSGRLGNYLMAELKKNHDVIVFDKNEPKVKDVSFYKGDILNIEDCKKAFKGSDVVVHLAAIPTPLHDPPEKVFSVNTIGTYNVHQAACDLGINKVVHASSDSSYGFNFRRNGDILLPEYLPLDEGHPQKPADPYGLSKKVGEDIALNFTRRYGIFTVALRICWVWYPEELDTYRKVVKVKDPALGSGGFWSYVDYRDAVQAFRLAVEVEGLKKHEAFLISASDNNTEFESKGLVKKYYSDKIKFSREINGRETLINYTKAKCLLGYKPKYVWKDLI
jgi:nucleoside-diphosphate-sugar epimerase